MVVLVLSMLASVVVWTYLASFKLAIVLITAIFIHEYGHFYWMGREGIKNKRMIFIPPFGAVAMSQEYWPSYGAEMRIALAGPIAGFLSVLLFYGLWLVYPNDIFLASIIVACILNLFNLVFPVAILDGGRVIKSILYSIHQKLGDAFYILGFILLGVALILGYLSFFFVMLIGFFLYQEWSSVLYARKRFEYLNKKLEDTLLENDVVPRDIIKAANEYTQLDAVVNLKKMSRKEMVLGALSFVVVILIYLTILFWVVGKLDTSNFTDYFKW